jgi:hypothetical protein
MHVCLYVYTHTHIHTYSVGTVETQNQMLAQDTQLFATQMEATYIHTYSVGTLETQNQMLAQDTQRLATQMEAVSNQMKQRIDELMKEKESVEERSDRALKALQENLKRSHSLQETQVCVFMLYVYRPSAYICILWEVCVCVCVCVCQLRRYT